MFVVKSGMSFGLVLRRSDTYVQAGVEVGRKSRAGGFWMQSSDCGNHLFSFKRRARTNLEFPFHPSSPARPLQHLSLAKHGNNYARIVLKSDQERRGTGMLKIARSIPQHCHSVSAGQCCYAFLLNDQLHTMDP